MRAYGVRKLATEEEGGEVRIIEDSRLTEQFRFPRTRKRRIMKKWTARHANHRASTKMVLYVANGIDYCVCHPATAQAIRSLERTFDDVVLNNIGGWRPRKGAKTTRTAKPAKQHTTCYGCAGYRNECECKTIDNDNGVMRCWHKETT